MKGSSVLCVHCGFLLSAKGAKNTKVENVRSGCNGMRKRFQVLVVLKTEQRHHQGRIFF